MMRIEFRIFVWPYHTYYEFKGIRERIRSGKKGFCWDFDGHVYETDACDNASIWCDDREIAVCSQKFGEKLKRSCFDPLYVWQIINSRSGRHRILEMRPHGISFVHWKATDGNRIMTFRRTACSRAEAVIRSDWIDEIGLLVGMTMRLYLNTG